MSDVMTQTHKINRNEDNISHGVCAECYERIVPR